MRRLAVLDLLDALVRKSLLSADRSAERTRFSMLETIRQFAEERLIASGLAEDAAAAHARYFAECGTDILALGDSPRQREAYDWFTKELPNLRTAFRYAADSGDVDAAATIATYAPFLGTEVGNYEPIAWAEELIEPARAVGRPRLAALSVMASRCFLVGRIEEALRYTEVGCAAIETGDGDGVSFDVPFGADYWLGGVYLAIGQPEWMVDYCRTQLRRGRDAEVVLTASLVIALSLAGSSAEAIAATTGQLDAARATRNPYVMGFELFAEGLAFLDAESARALAAVRQGLAIAQESGNHTSEAHLAVTAFRLEAEHGDALAALDYALLSIRSYHDSGNTNTICMPLAILVAFLNRRGRHEPAAVIAGFAFNTLTASSFTEVTTATAHLREVLGDQTYGSLTRTGEAMTLTEMANYAYEQNRPS